MRVVHVFGANAFHLATFLSLTLLVGIGTRTSIVGPNIASVSRVFPVSHSEYEYDDNLGCVEPIHLYIYIYIYSCFDECVSAFENRY